MGGKRPSASGSGSEEGNSKKTRSSPSANQFVSTPSSDPVSGALAATSTTNLQLPPATPPPTNSTHMDTTDGQTGASRAQPPQSCASSTCMFFGSANTEGFCSVCYKKEQKKRDDAAEKAMGGGQAAMAAAQAVHAAQQERAAQQTRENIISAMTSTTSSTTSVSSKTDATQAAENSNNSSVSTTPNNTSADTQHRQPQTSQPVPIPTKSASGTIPRLQTQMSSSAPVPVKLEHRGTPPLQVNPSSSSKRRSDDSFCSMVDSPTPGTPDSKKTINSGSPSKPKKRKCGVCKKKIGLTGFDCRCGGLYCPVHRYADQHNCQFDYAKAGKDQLTKDLQKIEATKVERI